MTLSTFKDEGHGSGASIIVHGDSRALQVARLAVRELKVEETGGEDGGEPAQRRG